MANRRLLTEHKMILKRQDLANFVAEIIPVKFADEEPKWKVWV